MVADFDVQVAHDLDQLVQRGVRAIVGAIEIAATELRSTHIPAEAPVGATGALSSEWVVKEVDPLTRIVRPSDEAWYAHIVARGRTGAQPVKAKALTVGDEFVAHVGGAAGDPFHERAIAGVEARGDSFIESALATEGL